MKSVIFLSQCDRDVAKAAVSVIKIQSHGMWKRQNEHPGIFSFSFYIVDEDFAFYISRPMFLNLLNVRFN